MISLRARIAILLISAILTVVGLATLAASRALQPPDPQTSVVPIAQQLGVLTRLARDNPQALIDAGGRISDEPLKGPPDERLTVALNMALVNTGNADAVQVIKASEQAATSVSINVGEGVWLIVPVPNRSPPDDGWKIFSIWIAIIIIGSALISLYAAQRLSRPLQLLQQLSGRVGPDGTLEHIPEIGPAEIRATASALNRLSEELRQAMESRIRLVAAAGHDLRTPMTRMRLRAEFIPDDEERDKWLSDLEELDLIADSAIRLAREEVSRDGQEPLRLDLLLQDIVDELREMHQKVEVLDMQPLKVQAGPLALKRALRNLILNAATHGGGARITLRRDGDDAVVTIIDDGDGIPPDLLGQVFEPFFRADPARRKTIPGAGLGLAIAREIVTRFGGTISISNRDSKGLLQQIRLAASAT
jgi:signal transduction histidine kinase